MFCVDCKYVCVRCIIMPILNLYLFSKSSFTPLHKDITANIHCISFKYCQSLQNQNSLLVKCQNNNNSPGPVMGGN